jgi:hypothetical protein
MPIPSDGTTFSHNIKEDGIKQNPYEWGMSLTKSGSHTQLTQVPMVNLRQLHLYFYNPLHSTVPLPEPIYQL